MMATVIHELVQELFSAVLAFRMFALVSLIIKTEEFQHMFFPKNSNIFPMYLKGNVVF